MNTQVGSNPMVNNHSEEFILVINRREIGLKLDGDEFALVSLDLGMGTTRYHS